MSICSNCGVELDDDMKQCPLCGKSVGGILVENRETNIAATGLKVTGILQAKEKTLLQRIVWQVTSIVLLSSIISTVIIDLSIHNLMTWSVFPVTICMIIFSYSSLFAFWHVKKIYQVLAGLFISSCLIIVLHLLLPLLNWPLQLGLPILVALNLIAMALIMLINLTKERGLNVIAYTCVAIAILCVCIEAALSLYKGNIVLRWSVIVAACLLPVIAALLFMHHRIKRNPDLEKLFHT